MAVRKPPCLVSPLLLGTAGRATERAMASTAAISSGKQPISYTTLKNRVSCEREIKKSKFVAIASHVTDEGSAHSFLSQVKDPKATHNCWAYKFGGQYRSNDDGEPSGTAGKPIYSAIDSSGLDMLMVVVIRYFGGIKLGTGGLVRAYGGIASECLRDAETCLVKSKVPIGIEVPFELLGSLYHQLQPLQIQSFHVEDIKQDYDIDKDGYTIISFKIDHDKVDNLENAIKTNCSRQIDLIKY